MNSQIAASPGVVHALRGSSRRRWPVESCDLCGVDLGQEHSHLLDLSDRQIVCACGACAVLFNHRLGVAQFVRIPSTIRRLTNFRLTGIEWAALMLPIDMAFFIHNTAEKRVIAYYPSPARAAESLLQLDAWENIVRNNPILERMEPDVEALLVNRTAGKPCYYIAPLDECYKLTGLIRTHCRGLSGGENVRHEIARFFQGLADRSLTEDVVHT